MTFASATCSSDRMLIRTAIFDLVAALRLEASRWTVPSASTSMSMLIGEPAGKRERLQAPDHPRLVDAVVGAQVRARAGPSLLPDLDLDRGLVGAHGAGHERLGLERQLGLGGDQVLDVGGRLGSSSQSGLVVSTSLMPIDLGSTLTTVRWASPGPALR